MSFTKPTFTYQNQMFIAFDQVNNKTFKMNREILKINTEVQNVSENFQPIINDFLRNWKCNIRNRCYLHPKQQHTNNQWFCLLGNEMAKKYLIKYYLPWEEDFLADAVVVLDNDIHFGQEVRNCLGRRHDSCQLQEVHLTQYQRTFSLIDDFLHLLLDCHNHHNLLRHDCLHHRHDSSHYHFHIFKVVGSCGHQPDSSLVLVGRH